MGFKYVCMLTTRFMGRSTPEMKRSNHSEIVAIHPFWDHLLGFQATVWVWYRQSALFRSCKVCSLKPSVISITQTEYAAVMVSTKEHVLQTWAWIMHGYSVHAYVSYRIAFMLHDVPQTTLELWRAIQTCWTAVSIASPRLVDMSFLDSISNFAYRKTRLVGQPSQGNSIAENVIMVGDCVLCGSEWEVWLPTNLIP
jgi:hypothetical protein